MPRIILRCDATTAGGVGHLARCIALAQAARAAGFDTVFSGRFEAPLALALLNENGFAKYAPENMPSEILLATDLVHIDGYDIETPNLPPGTVLSAAVDGPFGRRQGDVIVDAHPDTLHSFDDFYASADVCLGPKYIPLRTELAGAIARHDYSRSPRSVVVLMGGSDATGAGDAIAASLSDLGIFDRVAVVGTSSRPNIESIPRTPNIAAVLSGFDLVVTAAGTSLWECAALGIPTALVAVADNQAGNYRFAVDRGLAVGLGGPGVDEAVHPERVAAVTPSEWEAMTVRGRALVDGAGARRVVDAWRHAIEARSERGIVAHPARFEDAGRLFAWRNDAATRASSRSHDEVSWPDHLAWLERTLQSSDRRLFVVRRDGDPIATVRFDRETRDERSITDAQGITDEHGAANEEGIAGEWEISVTVAPDARVTRAAAPAIRAAASALAGDLEGNARIIAVIHESNRASLALFQSLGFERGADESAGWQRYALPLAELSA